MIDYKHFTRILTYVRQSHTAAFAHTHTETHAYPHLMRCAATEATTTRALN